MIRVKILLGVLLLVLAGFIVTGLAAYHYLSQPISIADDVVFELRPGQPFGAVATELHELGVIRYPQAWKVYALVTGSAHKIQAGEYDIRAENCPIEVLGQFTRGEVRQYAYTLVEGWTFQQVLADLQAQDKLNVVSAALTPADIMARLGASGEHPEGRFFADTYHYVAGTTDLAILARAHTQLQQVLAREWEARDVGLPYESAYQALIMASIIEKETAVPDERDEIAGVFVRRLRKNMRLQTDPTVIYGMGSAYDGNLRRRDLKSDTPYNTYVHKGLPPTPIAMVGQSAINAAVHPEEGDSLYFVAKGDGSHFFSATLDQHNRAVQEYQGRNRAKDYRSTPKSQ
jgi:UPF0755 protein